MSFYLIFFFYFDLLNFSKSLFMETQENPPVFLARGHSQ